MICKVFEIETAFIRIVWHMVSYVLELPSLVNRHELMFWNCSPFEANNPPPSS